MEGALFRKQLVRTDTESANSEDIVAEVCKEVEQVVGRL